MEIALYSIAPDYAARAYAARATLIVTRPPGPQLIPTLAMPVDVAASSGRKRSADALDAPGASKRARTSPA